MKKVRHAIQKYIELVEAGTPPKPTFNSPEEDLKLFGPRSGSGDIEHTEVGPEAFMKHVKQTGYVGFTYEGGTAEWDMFKCSVCRQEVKTPVGGSPPHSHQCLEKLEVLR